MTTSRTRAVPGALIVFVLLLSASPAFGADTYTIDFENENASISGPYVTFYGAAFSSTPQGADGTSIGLEESYLLSMLMNGIDEMPTDWGGNLYISDSALTETSPNPTITTDTTRYQVIEFAGSGTSAAPDITYINWYSFPVKLASTTSQSSQTRGMPNSGQDLDALPAALASLSIQSPTNTTVVRNAENEILRVIGPSNGNGPDGSVTDKYPSFGDYIDATFPDATPISTILIDNTYSGVQSPPNVRFENQDYTTSSISYDGSTLTINGSTTRIFAFTLTAEISEESLSEKIYRAVIDYDYSYMETDGGSTTMGSGNTGSNDVLATVTRDLLAGFAFGFIGSDAEGDMTSAEWQDATGYFGDIQPDDPFYNEWAGIMNEYFSDVYTFPFSDFLSSTVFTPTIQVEGDDTLTITLLAVPEPARFLQLGVAVLVLALRRRNIAADL